MVLLLKVPVSDGVALSGLALNSVTALPLASRIVFPVTVNVIVPEVASTKFPPPMMLLGLLLDRVLFCMTTPIVVFCWPVMFTLSLTQLFTVLPSPGFVPPNVVLITTPLLTRASTATHWLPSVEFCIPPRVLPLTVSVVVPAAVLTMERSRARPPLMLLLVKVTAPTTPLVVELPKWMAPSP